MFFLRHWLFGTKMHHLVKKRKACQDLSHIRTEKKNRYYETQDPRIIQGRGLFRNAYQKNTNFPHPKYRTTSVLGYVNLLHSSGCE